jgi:uncharacterized membrane protein
MANQTLHALGIDELSAYNIRLSRAITIRQPASALYDLWRATSRLASVIKYPTTIENISTLETAWHVKGPAHELHWKSVITEEEPGELLAWRSTEDSDLEHAGYVTFAAAPADEGTEVVVNIGYNPPAGKLGNLIAKLTRESADSQIYDTLHRLKALLETGEIPTTDGQPRGDGKGRE